MSEHKHQMYVKIVGEPFLSRAFAYRDAMNNVRETWTKFMQEKGASAIPGHLGGLIFSGKPPAGWTKVTRNGFSAPKKGHPDGDVIAALPNLPRSSDIFGDAIIDNLNYEGPDVRGSSAIGWLFSGPRVGWVGDTFLALIPDARTAADDHLAKHPDHKITSGADKWSLPVGLEKITKAEYDLIVAQFEVDEERERSAAA